MQATRKRVPALNPVRAKQLRIDVATSLLLSAEVVTDSAWNKQA